MAEGLKDVHLRRRYSSGTADLASSFFRPCLERSLTYDRAVGFFSSSFYAIVGVSIAKFVRNGGRIRLVCCPRMNPHDVAAVTEGYAAREAGRAVLREIDAALLDPVGRSSVTLLATLVAEGALDLRVAFKRDAVGIYHDKVGIFTDRRGDRVSFGGSANESWSAWSQDGNHESFHAFSSWSEPERVGDDVAYFEGLWDSEEPGLQVLPFPSVALDRLQDLRDLEGVEHADLEVQRVSASGTVGLACRPLRPHQTAVLLDWEAKGFRGLVEHATGSGKTLTALTAMRRCLDDGTSVLIVVPAIALMDQWRAEIEQFFGAERPPTLLVGGGFAEWQAGSTLRDFLGRPGTLVLATIDTASSEAFVRRTAGLTPLAMIVDEVHRAGSSERRRLLTIDCDRRLGLSATWRREGDQEGTQLLLSYFEHVLEPVYSLADAVRDGWLCPYRYSVHELALSDAEREEWKRQTAAIGRAIARTAGEMDESIRQMLIRRSRLVKQASAKVPLAANILRRLFSDGDAWLVYCDDTTQLYSLRALLRDLGVHSFEYHRQTDGDTEAALAEFERSGGIMLAIRCLDEGVDIPRLDHALILASSTTRREFIQRRGRVLRRAERKYLSEIHDLLVVPAGFDDAGTASFVRSEISRAREFVRSAVDSVSATAFLDRLERTTGAASTSFGGEGFEDEEMVVAST